MFRNTLTANDSYPVQECGKFSTPIQMEFYLKPPIFSDILVSFLESPSNFKHFEEKDDRQSNVISEIIDCERIG